MAEERPHALERHLAIDEQTRHPLTQPFGRQVAPERQTDLPNDLLHASAAESCSANVHEQRPGAATGQGAGTSGTSGTGAAGAAAPAPGTAPEHQRSGTEDLTRAVPTMKPGAQPASTGAAQGQGPGGWTADQKLRATGKEGAVENPGPGGAGAQPPAQQPSR